MTSFCMQFEKIKLKLSMFYSLVIARIIKHYRHDCKCHLTCLLKPNHVQIIYAHLIQYLSSRDHQSRRLLQRMYITTCLRNRPLCIGFQILHIRNIRTRTRTINEYYLLDNNSPLPVLYSNPGLQHEKRLTN